MTLSSIHFKILIILITLFIAFPSSSALTRYYGEGGIIPDNCYPEHCDWPSLDAFSSTLYIPDERKISHLSLTIDLMTGFSTDYMEFALIGPGGYAALTDSRPCLGYYEQKIFTFKDDASNDYIQGYEYACDMDIPSGDYQPVSSFESLFYDKPASGEWTLYIFDGWSRDEGEVYEWYLDVTTVDAPTHLILVYLSVFLGFFLKIRK